MMHSIINLKLWKKCIKRFSKKKLKQEGTTSSVSGHVQKSVPVPELDTSCKKSSLESLSLYSTDSLEEKSFFFRNYSSKKSYNQQLPKKSESLESIIANSIISDFSEDSLQRRDLSKDSLCMQMEECLKNINDSTESFKIKAEFSNNILLSKCQTRNRSQTIGQSYQLEKLSNKRDQKFFIDDHSHTRNKMPLSYERQLFQDEALSIDSLENPLTERFYSLKKKFISEDSLNEEKNEYFDKLSHGFRKKSISDGFLHEARYIQQLFHNRDFVFLNKILSNEIKKQYNIEKKIQKSNNDRQSLISLIKLQCIENYESGDDKLSIDSLSNSQSGFIKNVGSGIPEVYLKRKKQFSLSTSSYEHETMEKYESEDEKLSIDSLSIPQSKVLMKTNSEIKESSLRSDKPLSSNSCWYKNYMIENIENLYCSQHTKKHHSDIKKLETSQCYPCATHDKKCSFNDQDFKKYSGTDRCSYGSIYFRETGKEDTISIDSLCDSLN